MSDPNPSTLGLPKQFYTISAETGQFERVEVYRSPLSSVDNMLKTLAQDIPIFVRDMFVLPAGNVHVAFSSKMLTMVMMLPTVQLNTQWTLFKHEDKRKKGYFYPTFVDRRAGETVQLSPKWLPPANMRVFFCNHFDPSGQDGVYRHSRASLVAIHLTEDGVEDRKHYKLPLTNLYDNCKLCLGSMHVNDLVTLVTKPYADQMQAALNGFNASTWNSDLIQHVNLEHSHKLIQISVDDNTTTVNPWGDWHKYLPPIGNTDFATVPFHSIIA